MVRKISLDCHETAPFLSKSHGPELEIKGLILTLLILLFFGSFLILLMQDLETDEEYVGRGICCTD